MAIIPNKAFYVPLKNMWNKPVLITKRIVMAYITDRTVQIMVNEAAFQKMLQNNKSSTPRTVGRRRRPNNIQQRRGKKRWAKAQAQLKKECPSFWRAHGILRPNSEHTYRGSAHIGLPPQTEEYCIALQWTYGWKYPTYTLRNPSFGARGQRAWRKKILEIAFAASQQAGSNRIGCASCV